MYSLRQQYPKDDPLYLIAKLLMNSLYGKFGMKDITSKLKILSLKEANKIIKNYNYSVFAELENDKVLVKYSSRISEKLRKLFKENDAEVNKNFFNSSLGKKRGVPSSIQIACAISGYARVSMYKYKNMKDNQCIYTDTDSVVLEKPLNDNLIGKEIGQMKLENTIQHGFFIRKKLYAYLNEKGILIKKSSGIDSNKLDWTTFYELNKGNLIKIKNNYTYEVKWKSM